MTAPDDVRARLLPCPFCGCTDHEASPWPTDRNRDWWKCNCGNPECGVEVGAPTPDEAVAKWNRRAAHADLAGEVRELVEAAEEMVGVYVAKYAMESGTTHGPLEFQFRALEAALAKFTQEKP